MTIAGHAIEKQGEATFILDAFRQLLDSDPEAPLFLWRERGDVRTLNRGEFRRAVTALCDQLLDLGYLPGERIALLSESRPEWPIVFLAAQLAGLVVVPVDTKLSLGEVSNLLNHAEPSVLFLSRDCKRQFATLRDTVPSLRKTWILDDDCGAVSELGRQELVRRHAPRLPRLDDIAVIAYTSGTSAAPKGVMLTARNLWYEVDQLAQAFQSSRQDVTLSMLPLNHLLELTGGLFTAMFIRSRIIFANTLLPNELIELMHAHNVTKVVTVPMFLEHLQRGILRQVEKSGKMPAFLFRWMLRLAPHLPRFSWRRRLFRTLHAKFGGALGTFIVGGAPLRREVGGFFQALGIRVLQGYGLTETSPVLAVNRPGRNRLGSVGQPLEGVEVRIDRENAGDSEGEIVARGPNVMKGYYRDDAMTRKVIDKDGWFHTGDVGFIDEAGYLWVTGRKKNLIVTAGGKKILPEEVEECLALCPGVEEVFVFGVKTKTGSSPGGEQIVAVLRPDEATAKLSDAEALARLEKDATAVLSKIAGYKRPARFLLTRKEFPKTSTRKVKRQPLIERLTEEGLL